MRFVESVIGANTGADGRPWKLAVEAKCSEQSRFCMEDRRRAVRAVHQSISMFVRGPFSFWVFICVKSKCVIWADKLLSLVYRGWTDCVAFCQFPCTFIIEPLKMHVEAHSSYIFVRRRQSEERYKDQVQSPVIHFQRSGQDALQPCLLTWWFCVCKIFWL